MNVTSGKWTELAVMNEGRFGHAVVAVGEKIFAVGGDTKVPNIYSIEEYDISNNIWMRSDVTLKKARANFRWSLIQYFLAAMSLNLKK